MMGAMQSDNDAPVRSRSRLGTRYKDGESPLGKLANTILGYLGTAAKALEIEGLVSNKKELLADLQAYGSKNMIEGNDLKVVMGGLATVAIEILHPEGLQDVVPAFGKLGKLGKLDDVGDPQRDALVNAIAEAKTLSEKKGIVHGTRKMQEQGYELLDESFSYKGNQGIDLAFRHSETGNLAILEAKHGTGLGSLSTYKGPLRQGGNAYNIDRLEKYIDLNPNANVDLADDLIYGIRNNSVKSFGSFYRGNSLYELNFDKTVNFRLNPDAAMKVQ